jgi:hypothetical protein
MFEALAGAVNSDRTHFLRGGLGAAWDRLPGKLRGVLIVAAILGGMQLGVMWTTHQHDQRLVEI